MIEIDFSKLDPKILEEYCKIQNIIEEFLKKHPGKLSKKNQEHFSNLLTNRREIMSRLLKSNVYGPRVIKK